MPTTLAQLTDELRIALGLTPAEACELASRLVPVLQIAAVSEISPTAVGGNDALGRIQQVAGAADFPHGQLFNPDNSGTILLLLQAVFTSTELTDAGLARHDTPLTTLGTLQVWADFRRSGGPVGEVRRQVDAAQLGTEIYTHRVGADAEQVIDLPSPIVLAPGQGLVLRSSTFSMTANVSFFWREERL